MNRAPAVVLHKYCPYLLVIKSCIFDTISQPLPPEIIRGTKMGIMDFMEAVMYLRFIY
jgi:hypothetical protein